MDLSASHVKNLLPDKSNDDAYIPASTSNEPGCTIVSIFWKQFPLLASQKYNVPLSPPLTATPSSFVDIVLIIDCCPLKFFKNLPSLTCHFLILSADFVAEFVLTRRF